MGRLALIIVLVLLSVGTLIWALAGKLVRKKPHSKSHVPPPLPVQRNTAGTAGLEGRDQRLSHTPPLPGASTAGNSLHGTARRVSPLPQQGSCMSRSASIYSYPKCPYHRIQNEPGHPQVIIQEGEDRYYCCRGHYFSGKEQ